MRCMLSVNLNKICLLRNSRGRGYPDMLTFGRMALEAGADGLTIHPRPDQRHARYDDIAPLRELVEQFPGAELNIEGYPAEELLELVYRIAPHQCTLVPDGPDQLTSDHGWDPAAAGALLRPVLEELRSSGVRSSLFMDPEPVGRIAAAAEVGADRIELHTESYARAFERGDITASVLSFSAAADVAHAAGLGVNAGHDLDQANLPAFLEGVSGVLEVSIGHALTVEALEAGWRETVGSYAAIVASGAGQ